MWRDGGVSGEGEGEGVRVREVLACSVHRSIYVAHGLGQGFGCFPGLFFGFFGCWYLGAGVLNTLIP